MAPKKVVKSETSTPEVQVASEVPPPVVAEVPPVVSPTVDDASSTEQVDKFTVILEKLQTFQNDIKTVISEVKLLAKEYTKLQKQKTKKTVKKQVVDESGEVTKRQPSGFAKPTKLSPALCDFLGVPHETMMARTEVTRILNEYIKVNNLQNPKDRRKIIPDKKLETILTMTEGVPLSYFSLQSSIKSHFQKS